MFSAFVGFNRPELSKHKKRPSSSLSCDLLKSHSQRLFGNLQSPFWSRSGWSTVKREVELLAEALARYADLLTSKRARITSLHHSDAPARTVANGLTVDFIKSRHTVPSVLDKFTEAIHEAGTNVPVDLDPLLPGDRRRRYDLIQVLKCGLNSSAVLATYSTGSNIGSLHWLWLSSALQSCQPVIESLRSEMPQYHTRAMRSAMFEKFGNKVKKSVLRHFYRDLTGDIAASSSESECEVDERLCALFALEAPDILYDLRGVNPGRPGEKFAVFWKKAKEFWKKASAQPSMNVATHRLSTLLKQFLSVISKNRSVE